MVIELRCALHERNIILKKETQTLIVSDICRKSTHLIKVSFFTLAKSFDEKRKLVCATKQNVEVVKNYFQTQIQRTKRLWTFLAYRYLLVFEFLLR